MHQEAKQIALECGMPVRFINASSKDFSQQKAETAKRIVDDFVTKHPKQYFYLIFGGTGIGKSRLAALVFMSCIYKSERQDSFLFSWISLVTLYEKIKSTWNKESLSLEKEKDEIEVLNKYCYWPNILIFEFGDIKAEGNIYGGGKSPYITNLFHRVIDYRWKKRKKTLFVTPLGAKQGLHQQLIKHYDDATIGRLFEDCQIIKMTGEDLRIKKSLQRKIWEC
jgi:DNA replication protein DnaC